MCLMDDYNDVPTNFRWNDLPMSNQNGSISLDRACHVHHAPQAIKCEAKAELECIGP